MEQYRFNKFQILPPVVKNLLILNTIFFLGSQAAISVFHINLWDILGLHYFPSHKFAPYQLVTYMFMHGDIWHILFNMFALWMFGSAIENFWGAKKFIIFYFFTGIGAALLHYGILYLEIRPEMNAINSFLANPTQAGLVNITNQNFHLIQPNDMATRAELNQTFTQILSVFREKMNISETAALNYAGVQIEEFKNFYLNLPNVVGASGALFGLLIAFGWMFPNSYIFLIFPPLPIKAKYFVAVYGLLELISGVNPNYGGSNVAHFAHVGGMIFGFILLKIWHVRHLN